MQPLTTNRGSKSKDQILLEVYAASSEPTDGETMPPFCRVTFYSTQPAERLAMHERRSCLHNIRRLLDFAREKVALDSEHLGRNGGGETINLAGVLLDLPADKQSLEPARLGGQLEELLPLVLVKRRLLAGRACGVLGLALLLPRGDLLLLTAEGTLPVLEVVLLGLVVLDRIQHQVAALLEERVDAEVEGIKVGSEGVGADVGVARKLCERGGEVEGGLRRRCLGNLVEEAGEEVRVVDLDRQLDEDILVSEFRLLDAVGNISIRQQRRLFPFDTYLSLVNLPSLYAVMKTGLSL